MYEDESSWSFFGSGVADLKHYISNGCNVHDLRMTPDVSYTRSAPSLPDAGCWVGLHSILESQRPDPWCLRHAQVLCEQ